MWKRLLPWCLSLLAVAAAVGVAALAVRPAPLYLGELHLQRKDIRFDGARAFFWTSELVTRFPHRNAGGVNNLPAARWVADNLRQMGYHVTQDTWTEPLYGRPVELHNVVAYHPGSPGEQAILFTAHLDHAPTTIQGADNDGSGVGILLQLAELLADEPLHHPVMFLFSDAEEYGMLGVRRFVATQKDPAAAIGLAMTIDNAGKASAFGTDVEMLGQGRGYTPLGLFRLLQDLAPVADAWAPYPQDPVWQVVSRAVSLSFTDQGPLVRAGIPAITVGATGVWPYYHTPEDTLDKQSPETLGRMGRLAEGLLREAEAGGVRLDTGLQNYLYLTSPVPAVGQPGRYVPGWAISLLQLALLLPFAVAVWQAVRPVLRQPGWGEALAQISLGALPPLAGLLALPLLTRAGFIPRFAFYPAPPKDPTLTQVHWAGAAGFLLAAAAGGAFAVWLGRRLRLQPSPWSRPAALLVLLAISLAIWVRTAYAVLFILPALYAWPLIRGRWLSAPLLLLGGGSLYALLWLFGQRILDIGWYMPWYFLQMLTFGVVAPYTAMAGCLVIGCGVTLVWSAPQT